MLLFKPVKHARVKSFRLNATYSILQLFWLSVKNLLINLCLIQLN